MRKYNTSFKFVKTEDQAKAMCSAIDKEHSAYIKKHHPSTYAPWSASDGSFNGFAVFYVFNY